MRSAAVAERASDEDNPQLLPIAERKSGDVGLRNSYSPRVRGTPVPRMPRGRGRVTALTAKAGVPGQHIDQLRFAASRFLFGRYH
jgi:hypothetical protein